MSMKLYSDTDIADIASAIRSKNGTQTQYKVGEMGDAVRAIQTGENITFATLGPDSVITQSGKIVITFPVDCSRIKSFGLFAYDSDTHSFVAAASYTGVFNYCSFAYVNNGEFRSFLWADKYNTSGNKATQSAAHIGSTSPLYNFTTLTVYGHCTYV